MHTALIITDLTFGDAGKGTITDALVRRGANLVVRYNGGAQAAHTVIDATGHCHIFHQFGSGTLVDGVETFLSRYMLVNPLALYYEAQALHELGITDAAQRMHIDAQALVTTPYHMIANQLRELARGDGRHGSCGLGIGETASDALDYGPQVMRFGDLNKKNLLKHKLIWHREHKQQQLETLIPQLEQLKDAKIRALLDQLHSDDELEAAQEVFETIAEQFQVAPPNFLANRMSQPGTTVFEGAQGVLLDENYGFHPHTTWSTTTPANALQLIEESPGEVKTTVLGLTRAYQTRHGAGPFPTESEHVTQALPEPHNPTNPWQGPFRAGYLDLPLLRYAIQACGRIDGLIITCLDRLEELPEVKIATSYQLNGEPWAINLNTPGDLVAQEKTGQNLREVKVNYTLPAADPSAYAKEVAQRLNLPLLGTSQGPTAQAKWFDNSLFPEQPLGRYLPQFHHNYGKLEGAIEGQRQHQPLLTV